MFPFFLHSSLGFRLSSVHRPPYERVTWTTWVEFLVEEKATSIRDFDKKTFWTVHCDLNIDLHSARKIKQQNSVCEPVLRNRDSGIRNLLLRRHKISISTFQYVAVTNAFNLNSLKAKTNLVSSFPTFVIFCNGQGKFYCLYNIIILIISCRHTIRLKPISRMTASNVGLQIENKLKPIWKRDL